MRIDSMDVTVRQNVTAAGSSQMDGSVKQHTEEKQVQENMPEPNYRVSESFIRKAVEKANDTMRQHNRSLEFKIHDKTNEIIVKIVDTDTKEVIREIPSEKILDMFANMLELAGLIVDERR